MKSFVKRCCFFACALLISNVLYGYTIISENSQSHQLGYGDWYINTDGELHLLQQFLRPNDVVFDVGANVGEWSLYALGVEKSIQLYSFEPLPNIFSDMQAKLSCYPNVKAFQLALSDKRGSGKFCYYDETYEFSGLSGFYVREVLKLDHKPPKIIDIQQETIPNFCQQQHLDKIDFLKIDAEGAEWIIIKGAAPLIKRKKIRAIQFEYGGCYVDAKITLKEIYDFLSKNDYLVFRIMPNGLVHITQWNPILENFDMSNYVAIKKSDFIERLGFINSK
jgi:FkbM family methyltransferase